MGTVYSLTTSYETGLRTVDAGSYYWVMYSQYSGAKVAFYGNNVLMASPGGRLHIITSHDDGTSEGGGTSYSDSEGIGFGYASSLMGMSAQYATGEVLIDKFDSYNEAKAALRGRIETGDTITYRLTNCTAPGAPESARSGATVTVNLTPDSGFAFLNDSDVLVTNNGSTVQSTFSNGVLTFTMP